MSEIENTCENCAYEHESVDGFHCINCIHNAHENFKSKDTYESEQDIYERAYAEGRDKGYSCGEFSGYNKAIDEFAKELKSTLPIAVHRDCSEIDYEVDCALYNFRLKIDEIAEQMKAGVVNE